MMLLTTFLMFLKMKALKILILISWMIILSLSIFQNHLKEQIWFLIWWRTRICHFQNSIALIFNKIKDEKIKDRLYFCLFFDLRYFFIININMIFSNHKFFISFLFYQQCQFRNSPQPLLILPPIFPLKNIFNFYKKTHIIIL